MPPESGPRSRRRHAAGAICALDTSDDLFQHRDEVLVVLAVRATCNKRLVIRCCVEEALQVVDFEY